MDSNSEEEMVRRFVSRAYDSDSELATRSARFHLEAADWNLETALYNYLLHDGASELDNVVQKPSSMNADDSDLEFVPDNENSKNEELSTDKKKKNKKKPNTDTKFATLQNLNCDSSTDEEEGQAFYAGGSVRSGQQILGPGKNKNDIVSDMFRSVKEHGGIIMRQNAEAASSSFSGMGYKLGVTADDTTIVPDPAKGKLTTPDPEMVVILRLWRKGFSIDNGDLRSYDDPGNAEFLQYIKRGEIPPELRSGREIFLTMEDRRNEDFIKMSIPTKPFQGKGHLLGNVAPAVIGSTASQAIGTKDQEVNQSAAQEALNVDENEPITTIQFRLADGSRISGRFNHSHTIENLRQYVITAVPVYQLQPFTLLTTFPNKELVDLSQSVKEAGLINALVVQKLK